MSGHEPVRSRAVPASRIRVLVDTPPRPDGEFVLYWMTAARRFDSSYALDRAVELARELGRPLLVLEALRADSRWASDRHHAFVLQGMEANRRAAGRLPLTYHPFVERDAGEGKGLLEELARVACAVVTDDFPCFFLPAMLAAAARRLTARLEAVDGNGLLPMRAAGRVFPTAYLFRRHLQSRLRDELTRPPLRDPFAALELPRVEVPPAIARRWPRADDRLLAASPAALAELPIDHAIAPVAGEPGGAEAAARALDLFLQSRLDRYGEERNHPDDDVASRLSAYLHYGHLSSHRILERIAEREGWSAETLPAKGSGGRHGFWGMSAAAESFLDQVVTWREVGFNFCVERPGDHDRYDSLPEWARRSLEAHRDDARRWTYPIEKLAAAETHDEIWNAAQRQLAGEGRIHNYLRMLWGKRVLEWSEEPRRAAETLVELNDRYALDGRDPNSYSGIFWCFGRYDRPWAPERPIFGVVRYMSSEATRRKLRLRRYLERWSGEPALLS